LQSAFVVIDDLQHLEGKSAAQLELRQLLEILPNHDTQLVLTSRTAPSDLDFPADLRSRLGQGLVLPLRWPGQEARCEIIQRYLADRKRGIVLDQGPTLKSVENLAHSFPGSPSRLFAALAQLVHVAEVEQRPLDDRLIEEFLSASEESQITPRQIIAVVAKQRGVTVKDLKGPSRRQAINEARGIAMYLIRRLTTQTFEQIGEHFSGRDHTTVMHACEKTAERLAADPRLQQAVEQITSLLQEEI
jgi:chromosomal replication initiator protein